MFLKENMRNLKMHKGEGIDPFFIRIEEIWDHLATVEQGPQTMKLVCLALNNVSVE